MKGTKISLFPLTGLRFFLALWVVLFHQSRPEGYLGPWVPSLPETLSCLLSTGFVAVGVFFVLSGFILSYTYSLRESWSPAQLTRFAVARFIRIYPMYCVGLLLVLPFVVINLVKYFSAKEVVKQFVIATLNWTLLQAWVPNFAMTWNAPGWSLSAEAFFYCLFPFIGIGLWKWANGRSLAVVAVAVWCAAMLVPLISVMLPIAGFGDRAATAVVVGQDAWWWGCLITLNPLLRLPDFCAGILLCRVYFLLRYAPSSFLGRGYWLYVPGLILEGLAIANGNSLPLALVSNGLLLPLHALVILGLALGGGSIARFLSLPLVTLLGNASFALYIIHQPIAGWMDFVTRGLNKTALFFIYILLVIGLSVLAFALIEEPFRKKAMARLGSWQAEPEVSPSKTAA